MTRLPDPPPADEPTHRDATQSGTAKSSATDLVGQLLEERYQITACLGRGGMGTTWLAKDRRLHDREVVIKVPHPELRAMPEFGARYEREIRSMIDLGHPHIVEVLDVGDFLGTPFVVMQFISGGNLAGRIAAAPQGRLAAEQVGPWLLGIAQALDYMHARDLLHRDVKPENILISREGIAYLADFGIAKAVGPGDVDLTSTGFAPGTPKYMAPEQARSNEFAGEADQFALAVTAYEALSGRLPFSGATPVSLLLNKQTEAPRPLDDLSDEIPEDVARVLTKALATEPEDRFESCTSFVHALLQAFGMGTPSPSGLTPAPGTQTGRSRGSVTSPGKPTPADRPRTRRPGHLVALVGLLVALTVGLAIWQPWTASSGPEAGPQDPTGTRPIVDLTGGGTTRIDGAALKSTLVDLLKRYGGRQTARERLGVAYWIRDQLTLYGLEALPGRPSMIERAVVDGKHRLHNVYAWIPGSMAEQAEDGIGEYLVVSAHYDGLGVIDGRLHPGADNNGSGIVALLEMARAMHEMKSRGWPFRRSIVFAGLDLHHGERLEGGRQCLGAEHMASKPPADISSCVAFIALEQLGRSLADLLPRSLIVLGGEKSGVLDRLASEQPYEHGLLLRVRQDIYAGKPDTAPFLKRKIPALYVTGGNSQDYKRPGDTVDKMDFESFARRLEWLREFLHDVSNEAARPDWREDIEPTVDEVQQILAAFRLANASLQEQLGPDVEIPASVMSGIGVVRARLERIVASGEVTRADRRFYVRMLQLVWTNTGFYRSKDD